MLDCLERGLGCPANLLLAQMSHVIFLGLVVLLLLLECLRQYGHYVNQNSFPTTCLLYSHFWAEMCSTKFESTAQSG